MHVHTADGLCALGNFVFVGERGEGREGDLYLGSYDDGTPGPVVGAWVDFRQRQRFG